MLISKQFTTLHPIMTNKLYICIFLCVVSINSAFGQSNQSITTCKDSSDCEYYVEGSECINSECKCKEGAQLSGDGSKCVITADGYGASCEDSVQCSSVLGPGGICSSSTCACADTHHYRKGLCWRSISLNDKCSSDDQCYASFDFAGVSCQNGFCKCRNEYYEREMACRRKRNHGEDCVINDDCCPSQIRHGTCNKSRICECEELEIESPKRSEATGLTYGITKANGCPPGFFMKGTTCAPEIGTGCDKPEVDCTLGLSNSVCIDNRECGCNGTLYVRSINNRVCNKIVVAVTAACTESGQCAKFGGNSICDTDGTKKLCTCIEGSHFDNTNEICRTSRYLNDACTINEECYAPTGNIECNAGSCQCQNGTHIAASIKDCRPDGLHVTDECQEDTDCLFDNSICSEKKQCECQEHYFDQDGYCVKGSGSECSAQEECYTFGSTCSNSTTPATCQCPDDYVLSIDLSTCLPEVGVNEGCQQTDQCRLSMGSLAECRNGTCGCEENAQYVLNKCYLIKKLGEKCSARAECIYPGDNPDFYICQNAKCACQYGNSPSGDQCILNSK